jgi:hypothetical protein
MTAAIALRCRRQHRPRHFATDLSDPDPAPLFPVLCVQTHVSVLTHDLDVATSIRNHLAGDAGELGGAASSWAVAWADLHANMAAADAADVAAVRAASGVDEMLAEIVRLCATITDP